VNHAFCFELPVISFKKLKHGPFHGPEEEYVVHGETGFWISDHTVTTATQIVQNYFSDENLQRTMKQQIKNKIEHELTLQNMTAGIFDCINYLI